MCNTDLLVVTWSAIKKEELSISGAPPISMSTLRYITRNTSGKVGGVYISLTPPIYTLLKQILRIEWQQLVGGHNNGGLPLSLIHGRGRMV